MHRVSSLIGVRPVFQFLSALFAPRLEIASHRWSNSFNLVVGNSFEDRVLFWNARLLIPAWLDGDICCFRVDRDQLKDVDFLAVLGELLKQRNRVNTGGGGAPRLKVSSISLGSSELTEATELGKSTGAWGWTESDPVPNLDAVVPSAEEFQHARETIRHDDRFPRRNWVSFSWSPPTIRPPTIAPDHLDDAPPRHMFTGGFWPLDFGFQYDGPGRYPGGDNSWVLSRRWRMAGAFQISWEDDKVPWLSARQNRQGNLTFFVSLVRPVASIKISLRSRSLSTCSRVRRDVGEPAWPTRRVSTFAQSLLDKTIQRSEVLNGHAWHGGRRAASQPISFTSVLTRYVCQLGGSSKVSSETIQPMLSCVGKLAEQHRLFDLRSDREKEALAELIVKVAQLLKEPNQFR